MTDFKAPFPYFGGKATVALDVWAKLGRVDSYIEPFAGSLAVLLARPDLDPNKKQREIVNDKDGFVANFWRAMSINPKAVIRYADWPVTQTDLKARCQWFKDQRGPFTKKVEANPLWYSARIAGWWVWGASCSLMGNWPRFPNACPSTTEPKGILSNTGGDRLTALAQRLRRVYVLCGDWHDSLTSPSRLGIDRTYGSGRVTGVFLDPPYSEETGRATKCYAVDSGSVAHSVRDWCLENGANNQLRIALCGYGTEHDALLETGWFRKTWKAHGGISVYLDPSKKGGMLRRNQETIWFSPHCVIKKGLFS